MKTAILYRSMTGHSKKIARAIGVELGLQPQNIKTVSCDKLDGVDLAFIIGGIYSGKSLPEMIEYVKTLTPAMVKEVVLITSSLQDKHGQDEVRAILEANKIKVRAEEYRCRGNFLFLKMGHPNKNEITAAVKFAKTQIAL